MVSFVRLGRSIVGRLPTSQACHHVTRAGATHSRRECISVDAGFLRCAPRLRRHEGGGGLTRWSIQSGAVIIGQHVARSRLDRRHPHQREGRGVQRQMERFSQRGASISGGARY
jgi:hypothetical protein